jgi:hypothetical protein
VYSLCTHCTCYVLVVYVVFCYYLPCAYSVFITYLCVTCVCILAKHNMMAGTQIRMHWKLLASRICTSPGPDGLRLCRAAPFWAESPCFQTLSTQGNSSTISNTDSMCVVCVQCMQQACACSIMIKLVTQDSVLPSWLEVESISPGQP